MSERWVPLLAAVVGLLGGMGGAFVGGWVANEGQRNQFEDEQEAETRNLRIDAYVDLLDACETAFYIPEEGLSDTERNQRVADLRTSQQRASLLTSRSEVREAARELGPNEGGCGDISTARHISAQESFIEAASLEVTADK